MTQVPSQYATLVASAAQQLGIPSSVVAEQFFEESSWNPNSVSPTGAQGLAQFEPGTWATYGSGSPFNPTNAFNAYTKFMGALLRQFGGNLKNALAAYNAGAGNIGAGMGYASKILSSAGVGNMTASPGSSNTSSSIGTDAAGVSLANSSISAFQAATPTLSLDALRSTAPLVAALVDAVPELDQIFQKAVAESWSSDKFIGAIQNSSWWATHSDTARQALATMKSDPASWNQTVNNLQSKLSNLAAQYGATGASQSQINQIAIDALTNGFDGNDAVLRQKFEQFIVPISGLHFGGEAGGTETSIRQAQNQLGVYLPESQLDSNVKQITGGQMSINDVTSNLRSLAEGMYPAYKQQIQQGMNVSDIASPYIQRAQQLLEGGDGLVNMQTPMIKQALQYTAKGVPTPMPLGDFETATRKDPRWLSTDNAQDGFMSNAHKILVDFGLNF